MHQRGHACIVCNHMHIESCIIVTFRSVENISKIMSTPDMLHQIRSAACLIKLIQCKDQRKWKSLSYSKGFVSFFYKEKIDTSWPTMDGSVTKCRVHVGPSVYVLHMGRPAPIVSSEAGPRQTNVAHACMHHSHTHACACSMR